MSVEEKLDQLMTFMMRGQMAQSAVNAATPASTPAAAPPATFNGDAEALYQSFKQRLIAEAPGILQVIVQQPELVIEIEKHTIKVSKDDTIGRVAMLIYSGKLDQNMKYREILKDLEQTGTRLNNKTLSNALKDLVIKGFLIKATVDAYRAVPEMKRNVVTREAK